MSWVLTMILVSPLAITGLLTARQDRSRRGERRRSRRPRGASRSPAPPRDGGQLDDGVVEALEAMLAGRYVEYLAYRNRQVPDWAWTNLLAHGTEDEVRRVALSRPRPIWDRDVWRRARSYVAREVLDAARQAGSLRAVQDDVLVPLELHLMSWMPTRWWCSAGEWATRVLTALDDYAVTRSRRAGRRG